MFAALKAGTCKGGGKKKGEREDGGTIYDSIEWEGKKKRVCTYWGCNNLSNMNINKILNANFLLQCFV